MVCIVNLKVWVTIIVKIKICTHHFVASANENGNGSGVFTLLDNQHTIFCGTKGDFLHQTSQAKLLWRQLTEPWYNPTSRSYSNQLQGEKTQNCNSTQTLLHRMQT